MSEAMINQTQTAAGAGPKGPRPQWTSSWRARYRAGDWLALCGPTSLVVMQPAAPQWSDLVSVIWEEVLAAASIHDLAARLASFRLDAMPDFAALFWSDGRMRSLVRGAVRLVDPDSGAVIADGEGIQTWSEIGLSDRRRVEVHSGGQRDGEQLELPLVVGAATVSRVLLDCSEPVQISSPQGLAGETTAPAVPTGVAEPGRRGVAQPTRQPERRAEPEQRGEQPEPTVALADLRQPGPPEDHRAAMEDAETLVDQPPVPPFRRPAAAPGEGTSTIFASSLPGLPVAEPRPGPRPVVGVLHPSSGGRVEVDRPVVIGRAPSASRISGDQLPRLLTVPSPSHDISRTHLQVAPDGDRLAVTDLHSTNGTILVGPDGRRRDLPAGVGVPLEYGSVIDLGDGITIAVERT